MQFSGKRPRPEFITPIFDKHYNLFQGAFSNNSTSPAKYDPVGKEFKFDLDFTRVGRKNPKALAGPGRDILSGGYHTERGTAAADGAGQRLAQSLNAKDLITMKQTELKRLMSPGKIGRA